jgi:hypothetical protein
MQPEALFVITSDPRVSARPAEAIRIAAGVGVLKKVGVAIYLRGAAVLALSEQPEGLLDEDNYTRYLPIIGEIGRPIQVQAGAPLLAEIGGAAVPFEEISDEQLATRAAQSSYVLLF